MQLNLRRSWLRLVPCLIAAACASSSGGSQDPVPAATGGADLAVIEIQHNLPGNSSTLTILIEPQAGVRAMLGVVEPGQTKRFTYNAVPGNYTLLAQGSSNSPSFRLSNRDVATWNMQTNRVLARNK